ncbi:hypothetical protein J4444_00490 [Candidatus Woesearchaeota archaeon]|nr:hypothetical protein [Candidatus Woesearchaeota archaeon]
MKTGYKGLIKFAEKLMWPVGGIMGILLADSLAVPHPRMPEYEPRMCYSSDFQLIDPYSIPEVPVADAPNSRIPAGVSDLEKMTSEEVINSVSTPEQALQVMCLYYQRNGRNRKLYGKYQASFSEIHDEKASMDCTEGTEVVTATLSDNGYLPFFISMSPPSRNVLDSIRGLSRGTSKLCISLSNNELPYVNLIHFGHQIFLYKQSGTFHYLDINDCVHGQDQRGFLTVEELVKAVADRINMPVASFCVYQDSMPFHKKESEPSMDQIVRENQNTTCYPR